MYGTFQNEPLVAFADDKSRSLMQDAIKRVGGELGRDHTVVIADEHIHTDHTIASRNPARLTQSLGVVHDATPELVDRAVDAATEAFASWSRLSFEERSRYLAKAAAMLRRRIYEFSAWMVYEASKSWPEAYGDAAEAVDFLEYYAREAVRMGRYHEMAPYPGEENELRYIPMGVGAIISPWNFPLAILCGMTAAAIVTGNTVVIKPAEQTPIVASKFWELLHHAGVPRGVVNFVPGPGETVGEALTGHPGVHFVSFTGSRDVGLRIYQRIATPVAGQRHIKKAVLEMGGKDAIIVDHDVNLDGAADGIVASAFGFQGQKCSACSRLIVHEKVYDAILPKLAERTARLTVGDPTNPANQMGAVIDADAYTKVVYYSAVGRAEARLLCGADDSNEAPDGGYFVHPSIFVDARPDARIAQDEIFGPLLTVIRAESFEDAIDIANNSDYGLTGGVYSYNRENLALARREFQVGNLYLNRKITGAMVGVQPFGGFKLSGTCSKAGGPDYLGHFLQSKAICERW